MTNEQLSFAVGVPILVNVLLFYIFYGMITNKRIDDLRDLMNSKFDDVNQKFDARLKSFEEKYK